MASEALLRARLLTAGLRHQERVSPRHGGEVVRREVRLGWRLVILLLVLLLGFLWIVLPALRSVIPIVLIGLVAIGVVARVRSARLQRAALLAFERDYPAFLMSIASRVKTGVDPFEALLQGAEGVDQSSLLSRALQQAEQTRQSTGSEQAAIHRLVQEIPHGDVPLLGESLRIARITGAAISSTLYRLAKVTRARQSFRRKANAAVAMQRLSTYGILGCCSVLLIAQSIALPGAIAQVFGDRPMTILFLGGLCCLGVGSWWMLWLTRVKVG